jgi:RHS repeat-associated protein
LLSVTGPSSAPSGSRKALHFGYDWQGRRLSKIVSNWTGSAWSRVLHEKYLYDGWNLVAVLNGTNNALIKSFLWGSDLSGTMQGAGGVAGLLAMNVAGGSVYFAAYDGNGNVVALVNGSDGTGAAQYEYGPFGELIRCSGTASKTNPFRFSSKYQDDESDLLYYGHRYYSASIGRWLSRDPIGEKGTASLYTFVINNPIFNVDLLGNDLLPGDYVPIWPNYDPRTGCYRGADGRFICPPIPPPPGQPIPRPNPPPGVPPSSNTKGCSNPASGAAGAAKLCADICTELFNRKEYNDGIKICRSRIASQATGEKCCVIVFCEKQCCVSGRLDVKRVMTYLENGSCSAAQKDFETPGRVLQPSCAKGERKIVRYETMF